MVFRVERRGYSWDQAAHHTDLWCGEGPDLKLGVGNVGMLAGKLHRTPHNKGCWG